MAIRLVTVIHVIQPELEDANDILVSCRASNSNEHGLINF